jgi:hypothetical protein
VVSINFRPENGITNTFPRLRHSSLVLLAIPSWQELLAMLSFFLSLCLPNAVERHNDGFTCPDIFFLGSAAVSSSLHSRWTSKALATRWINRVKNSSPILVWNQECLVQSENLRLSIRFIYQACPKLIIYIAVPLRQWYYYVGKVYE